MPRSMLLCALILWLGAATSVQALSSAGRDTNHPRLWQLDARLDQSDAMKQRLDQLQQARLFGDDFWVDRHGVMRSPSGEPIGIWGMDGPTPAMRRR